MAFLQSDINKIHVFAYDMDSRCQENPVKCLKLMSSLKSLNIFWEFECTTAFAKRITTVILRNTDKFSFHRSSSIKMVILDVNIKYGLQLKSETFVHYNNFIIAKLNVFFFSLLFAMFFRLFWENIFFFLCSTFFKLKLTPSPSPIGLHSLGPYIGFKTVFKLNTFCLLPPGDNVSIRGKSRNI